MAQPGRDPGSAPRRLATRVTPSQASLSPGSLVPRPVPVQGTARKTPITHRHFDVTACFKAFPTFHYTRLADGLRASQAG